MHLALTCFLWCCVSFISCKQDPKNSVNATADNSNAANQEEEAPKKRFGLDAVDFGMSPSEFAAIGFPEGYPVPLGKYGYKIVPVYTKRDELRAIVIKGLPTTDVKQYTTFTYLIWEDLIDVFTLKYRKTIEEPKIFPPAQYLKDGRLLFTHEWKSGDKTIQLGLINDKGSYSANVFIENKSYN